MIKHGSARCPICGSGIFATMDEKLILKETDKYIQQNGELVKVKENEKTNLQKEIESLYEYLIAKAKGIVDKEKGIFEEKISVLKKLNDELKPYFDSVRKIQGMRKEISIESINNENMGNLQKTIKKQILSEAEEKNATELYQKILTVLGYSFSEETLQQLYEKIKNLISKS